MKKTSHPRPHLDHLRRQAKTLLADIPTSDCAAQVMIDYLPAARNMNLAQVRHAGFRLADAQSAIARQQGFAGWPGLAAHVEALRSLEGTWRFLTLEIDGAASAPPSFASAQMLIDGDRFCMRSLQGNYDGVFNIDVEVEPRRIDIHFINGPEAGNSSCGIFELVDDQLLLCLALGDVARPPSFATSPGSGLVLERLHRADAARPAQFKAPDAPLDWQCAAAGFAHQPSTLYAALEGGWTSESAMRDGQAMPESMRLSGERLCHRNEVVVKFGGRTVIDALFRVDTRHQPAHIDYLHRSGVDRGQVQLGIFANDGDRLVFCSAPVGEARPGDFSCEAGSGRTLSRWRRR